MLFFRSIYNNCDLINHIWLMESIFKGFILLLIIRNFCAINTDEKPWGSFVFTRHDYQTDF